MCSLRYLREYINVTKGNISTNDHYGVHLNGTHTVGEYVRHCITYLPQFYRKAFGYITFPESFVTHSSSELRFVNVNYGVTLRFVIECCYSSIRAGLYCRAILLQKPIQVINLTEILPPNLELCFSSFEIEKIPTREII